MNTPEVVPSGEYDSRYGFQIDGNIVKFWATKSQAREAAKAIGWPMNSVERVWTRFCLGWALKQEHGGLLTKTGYQHVLDQSF